MRRLSAVLALAVLAAGCTKSHPSATEPPTSGVPPTSSKVASVSVTPTSASIAVGETVQLQGLPRDINGRVTGGTQILWTSVAPTIASISQSGLATGMAAGSAMINYSVDGYVAQAAITVTKAP
jgi:uncharacterized protein YjdB